LRTITTPALLITGNRSALITPEEARDRASHLPNAEVAVVPGSHGGFRDTSDVSNRIVTFINTHPAGQQAAQAARPPATTS
jgi:pimeloyl-ACP methyl ester carboxylesterase